MIPSTSMSVKLFRKFASDIIPLACFQDTSLKPRMTTMHSDTICTARGGLANDLWRREGGKSMAKDYTSVKGILKHSVVLARNVGSEN